MSTLNGSELLTTGTQKGNNTHHEWQRREPIDSFGGIRNSEFNKLVGEQDYSDVLKALFHNKVNLIGIINMIHREYEFTIIHHKLIAILKNNNKPKLGDSSSNTVAEDESIEFANNVSINRVKLAKEMESMKDSLNGQFGLNYKDIENVAIRYITNTGVVEKDKSASSDYKMSKTISELCKDIYNLRQVIDGYFSVIDESIKFPSIDDLDNESYDDINTYVSISDLFKSNMGKLNIAMNKNAGEILELKAVLDNQSTIKRNIEYLKSRNGKVTVNIGGCSYDVSPNVAIAALESELLNIKKDLNIGYLKAKEVRESLKTIESCLVNILR